MNIVSYIDPQRSLLPATGVGRHMNNMLLGLAGTATCSVSTLFARQFLGADGKLPANSPIRDLPAKTIPLPIQFAERMWKLLRAPSMDGFVRGADWVYLPEECLFPVRSVRTAATVHDLHAFETDLPWSSTDVHRKRKKRWSLWTAPMLRNATRILTVSEFTRRRIVELFGADERKISVVGNGVESEFFRVASIAPESLPTPVPSPYVLVIGGLSARKGGDHVLAVSRELSRIRSDLRIVVAGRSESRLEQLAADHPRITLLGPVPDAELPRMLRASLGLLFLSEYEGFGIPAIEALAAGVPAIVSNRAALPETVGPAGIVVDPEHAPAVADLLAQLLRSPAAFGHNVQLGHAHAARFHWSQCVTRLVTSLQQ